MIDNIKDRKASTLIKYINRAVKKYTIRGFTVTDIFGDGEFDVDEITSAVLPATLHTCLADEHIHRIKRTIKTIKERARTICHSLPYNYFPKSLTISLMINISRWLNQFLHPNGISKRYSPANVIDWTVLKA